MRASALERLLIPEREPRRASAHGGFALPALSERAAEEDEGPYLATTMRPVFLETRRNREGNVRFGYMDLMPEDEHILVSCLYQTLCEVSIRHGWANRCRSLEEATKLLQQLGFDPYHLVVGPGLLEEACGAPLSVEDAEKLMMVQGYVAEVGELKVLAADLPSGAAMVTTSPSLFGVYSRVDDRLGLLLKRVDRAVVLVTDDMV